MLDTNQLLAEYWIHSDRIFLSPTPIQPSNTPILKYNLRILLITPKYFLHWLWENPFTPSDPFKITFCVFLSSSLWRTLFSAERRWNNRMFCFYQFMWPSWSVRELMSEGLNTRLSFFAESKQRWPLWWIETSIVERITWTKVTL